MVRPAPVRFSVKGFAYAVRRERAKSRFSTEILVARGAQIEMKTRGIVKREEEEEEVEEEEEEKQNAA